MGLVRRDLALPTRPLVLVIWDSHETFVGCVQLRTMDLGEYTVGPLFGHGLQSVGQFVLGFLHPLKLLEWE